MFCVILKPRKVVVCWQRRGEAITHNNHGYELATCKEKGGGTLFSLQLRDDRKVNLLLTHILNNVRRQKP